jgi:hypothetical protein
VAFSEEELPKVLREKTKMHIGAALTQVAEPVGAHGGVVRGVDDFSTMLKARYWQQANVVDGVADFFVRVHSSAWTPAGKITACLQYYGKPRSAVAQRKGGYVIVNGFAEVWRPGLNFTAVSEQVAIIQEISQMPPVPGVPKGFLAFEEAGIARMVALQEMSALTVYASTIDSNTKIAAVYAPWVGDHTSHQMASK